MLQLFSVTVFWHGALALVDHDYCAAMPLTGAKQCLQSAFRWHISQVLLTALHSTAPDIVGAPYLCADHADRASRLHRRALWCHLSLQHNPAGL